MPAHAPAASDKPTSGSLLGAWIRKTRADQAISQRALADRSGLSRSYVCDIERGRGAHPSVATLDKLAAALGFSRDDLLKASGLIDQTSGPRPNDDERRMLSVYRDLSAGGRRNVMRFARFVHADEHHWTQPQLLEDPMRDDGAGDDRILTTAPASLTRSLFDPEP